MNDIINYCSEVDCPANDGKNSCLINNCFRVNPYTAMAELTRVKNDKI